VVVLQPAVVVEAVAVAALVRRVGLGRSARTADTHL
jgi:hypothetical protein